MQFLISRLNLSWLSGFFLTFAVAAAAPSAPTLSLAGEWQIRLDPKLIGISQNWLAPEAQFDQILSLPGTTDQAGLGIPLQTHPDLSKSGLAGLVRKNSFIGPAWYRRNIDIPDTWRGKRVTLFLERVLWESQVWIDGKEIGKQNSLSTPHIFELPLDTSCGQHQLVIRVDNRIQFETGRSHAYIEDTQSIWNGIIGKIELRSSPITWIDSIRVDPNPLAASAEVHIGNLSGKSGEGMLVGELTNGKHHQKISRSVKWDTTGGVISLKLAPEKGDAPWSEFHPNLCKLSLTLQSKEAGNHTQEVTFGFRKIATNGPSLELNDIPLFLRGTHEGASFPLTGYPPMDVEGWRRLFKILKEWGLNHMRFHSYCPPDACFTAADEEGIYLQAELPLWVGDLGKKGDDKRTQWVRDEAKKIMANYGNHPSLILFSLGNELHGEYQFLQNFLRELKISDTRRLYTMTSNRLWVFDGPAGSGEIDGPTIADDFLVERAFRKDGKIEGMRGQSFFSELPNTSVDFQNILGRASRPLITHEIGQWTTFPNLAEISKYTGVLRPINLEAIRDDLTRNGLIDQVHDFTKASGKFSAELYKQEIELALRSKTLAGYQMLDLHDYPGQGTAHVGLLDSFWDSKQIAEPSYFREVCAPVVPLARMAKRVYTNDEEFVATVEFVNHSENTISNVHPVWEITTKESGVIARGTLPTLNLTLGACIPAGTISIALAEVTKATLATLRINAPEANASNSWSLWIIPAKSPPKPKSVVVTDSISHAKKLLKHAGKVLYCPNQTSILKRQDTAFLPAFWSPVYFTNQSGTMGLLIQSQHPALAEFPTSDHSDWQWWSILSPSPGAVVLDQVDLQQRPIVQVIDSFSRNQKLAFVFEARVDEGHLIVCAADLTNKGISDPMCRQLRSSLVRYLALESAPNISSLSEKDLDSLFRDDPARSASSGVEWLKDLEPPPPQK